MKWIYKSASGDLPSLEHQDQIYPWDEELHGSCGISGGTSGSKASITHDAGKYVRHVDSFVIDTNINGEVKQGLYNRGIALRNKVFLSIQPDWALVVTWKMVIHYSSNPFVANDRVVWDKTTNQALYSTTTTFPVSEKPGSAIDKRNSSG